MGFVHLGADGGRFDGRVLGGSGTSTLGFLLRGLLLGDSVVCVGGKGTEGAGTPRETGIA